MLLVSVAKLFGKRCYESCSKAVNKTRMRNLQCQRKCHPLQQRSRLWKTQQCIHDWPSACAVKFWIWLEVTHLPRSITIIIAIVRYGLGMLKESCQLYPHGSINGWGDNARNADSLSQAKAPKQATLMKDELERSIDIVMASVLGWWSSRV